MGWTVKRIQEDDYGCEERLEDAKVKVLKMSGCMPMELMRATGGRRACRQTVSCR